MHTGSIRIVSNSMCGTFSNVDSPQFRKGRATATITLETSRGSQHDFNELVDGDATCLVLTRNSADLPIPNNSVDAVITDPPYGGNVNYAELSDFWYIWMNDDGKLIEKKDEAIINRWQGKSLEDYERLLKGVFDECYRVLKPDGDFVSTFNSKDFRVVGKLHHSCC